MTILLISDKNNNLLNVFKNYNVDIANNYEESLSNINSNKYKIIIIDSYSGINIRKLLNEYKNKKLIKNTIILSDINLSSYELIDRRYQVFSIIKRNDIENLTYYVDELSKKIKIYNEDIANIYKDISYILKKMGISPEKDGFHYLRKAIYECYKDPSLLEKINTKLYPILAKTFNTNIKSIIRSMNYAIEIGFNKSDYEYEEKLFSNTLNIDRGKPTNISFISIIVDELLLEHDITYY